MRTILFPFIISLFILTPLYAQPAVEFMRNYNTGRHDKFYDIYALAGGGYAMCGISSVNNRGSGNLYVVKADEQGDEVWSRTYDTGDDGFLYSIIETDDGDLITAGVAVGRFHALRISPEGELRWRLDFDQGECQAVIELKDGRLLLAGRNSARVPYDSRVICINGNGEVQWDRTYDQIENSVFYGMRETDGGCVAAGKGSPEGVNRTYPWGVKFRTDNGDPIWTHHYSEGNQRMTVRGMTSAGDGGFVIIGEWYDGRLPGILKIDADGNEVWRRVYEDLGTYFWMQNIVRTRDMGFALGGYLARVNDNNALHRPAILRIASDGSERWHAFYDVDEVEGFRIEWNDFNSIAVNNNDELIGAGTVATSVGDSTFDGFIMMLQPNRLGPGFTRISPEDTVLNVLSGSEVEFQAVAVSDFFRELRYKWTFDGDSVGIEVEGDTLAVASFDSLGEHLIECRISDFDGTVSVRWHVTVSDLFIASYAPDTLELDLRRGTSQTFSLDSVAVIGGDPVNYQWTLTDLNSFEAEDAGMETGATVDFFRSGNFQLEGLAYRGESSDNVVWTISVRSAILDFTPRSLALATYRDSTLQFSLLPFNPESDSLKYNWLLDGTVSETDTLDNLSFTFSQTGQHQVSGILLDGVEGDTINWTVTVEEPGEVDKWTSGQVDKYELLSAYPNPFNSTTTIRFTVPSSSSSTSLTLHDLSGRQVRECLSAEVQAGEHTYLINGEDFPAGIYLIRLITGNFTKVKKVVLVR